MHLLKSLRWIFITSLVVAACGKSPAPSASNSGAPGNVSSPVPTVPDAAVVASKRPMRLLDSPARLVKDPQRFRFLVFGDSRDDYCRCDPPRKHRNHCRVRYTQSPSALVKACALVAKAPALLLGAVAQRLRSKGHTPDSRVHFSLFTGDLVYRGSCAKDWNWARRVFLSKAPANRVFPIIGNHDSWRKRGEPPASPQFLRAFPHLAQKSLPKGTLPHYYAFRIGRSLFINLCTGGYPSTGTRAEFKRADRKWLCERASFETQMRWMDRTLAYGVSKGVHHVFVQYHKPSFSCSSHPPLNKKHDPLTRLHPFKKRHPKVNVVALSGHNHTTAVYVSGGVLVLVAGGGGAPQHYQHGPQACHKDKPDQPPEQFWKGSIRTVRYNYFQVDVTGRELSIQEHCLARIQNKLAFQKASRISATGQITHLPGTCDLSPKPRKPAPKLKK